MITIAWQQRRPKVAIGVPFQKNPSPDWAIQYSRIQKPEGTMVISQDRGTVDFAREDITKTFLEDTNAENLFFLDSDVIPPRNSILRLLNHNLPVVSGIYYSKKDPIITEEGKKHYPAAWKWNEEERKLQPIIKWRPGSIIEVDSVGMGFCLISRRVLESLSKPRFRWTKGMVEKDHPWSIESEAKGVGEDFFACYKIRNELGMKIYLDTGLEAHHEIPSVLGRDGRQKLPEELE